MEFRPATACDLAGEFQVFELAQRELYDRRGADWEGRDFAEWEPVHLHLLEHDGARSVVAEEAGRVVGFTAAWVREDVWFLSALFVLPERQGRGIGTRLLELAWGEGYSRRLTITAAIQPVSTATYARRGLIPMTPILNFELRSIRAPCVTSTGAPTDSTGPWITCSGPRPPRPRPCGFPTVNLLPTHM